MEKEKEKNHPLYRGAEPPEGARRVVIKASQSPRVPREDRPLLTYLLMVANGLIFLVGYLSPELEWELFLRGALIPQLVVLSGEVYRLVSAMFLHGSLGHVFFNVYALYVVGRSVEPIFGRFRFLLIYVLGGLTGSALSLLLGGLEGASVGASGAVFAIFAAEGVHLYQHRRVYANVRGRLQHMLFLIGVNLFIGFTPGSRIDSWGISAGCWVARCSPGGLRRVCSDQLRRCGVCASLRQGIAIPLVRHLPELVVYIFALVAIVYGAISLLSP